MKFYGHAVKFQKKTRFLIYAIELKLQPLEVSPYVCTGKPYICNVFRPRSTWGVWSCAHMNVTTITQFVQICSMHASRHYGTTSYTVLHSGQWFFFLLLVSATWLEKKRVKKKFIGAISEKSVQLAYQCSTSILAYWHHYQIVGIVYTAMQLLLVMSICNNAV